MGSTDELILRATKEIIVKFIETGRLGPTGFHETFKSVYKTVEEIATGSEQISEQDTEAIDSWNIRIYEFSQSISATTGLMIGHDIDYFQVLTKRLDTYVAAMAKKPDAPQSLLLQ